jgi:hypothetical protein
MVDGGDEVVDEREGWSDRQGGKFRVPKVKGWRS